MYEFVATTLIGEEVWVERDPRLVPREDQRVTRSLVRSLASSTRFGVTRHAALGFTAERPIS